MELWLIGAIVVVLGYILYIKHLKLVWRVQAMFPGGRHWPIIGNALQLFVNRKDLYGYFTEEIWFFRRSMRLFVLNIVYIIIVEPEDVEKIWGSTTHLEKADAYKYLSDWLGLGLLTSTGEKWRKSRKILTPAFHFHILESFLDVFQRNGKILQEKINENLGKSNFDVCSLIKLYALDNICECAMGTQIKAQENPDGEYVQAINTMCEVTFTRAISPWYWPEFIFKRTSLGKRQEKSLSVIHGLTKSVIERRKMELQLARAEDLPEDESGIRKKRVFMDILLTSNEGGGLTSEEVREEVDTFMFEGHDTVTSAMSFTMYLLSQHSKYQERAYQEIISVLGDSGRAPTIQNLNDMKFLEMVIKETLRLYPSVPLIGRHVHEDIVLDERATIPKGSHVLVSPAILSTSINKWEKSHEFYPEHFDVEAASKRHPYQYMPFSAGPRNCIGMRFAMYEMKSTLCTLLRKFEILPADPEVPLKLNVDLILKSESGVHIRVKERKN